MNEDTLFFKRAYEAITTVSSNVESADPVIRELLNRLWVETSKLQSLSHIRTNNMTLPPDTTCMFSAGSYNTSTRGSQSDTSGNGLEVPGNSPTATEDLGVTNTTAVSPSSTSPTIEGGRKGHKKPKVRKKTTTGEKEERFPCSKCELVFTRSADLVRHERAHSLVLPNICSKCGKGFARKDALKRHFDTLTCRRNRRRLIEITNGKFEEFLERATREGISL